MIEWTTHFKRFGLQVDTCDYGGLFITWGLGRFSMTYYRAPVLDEVGI